MRPARWCCGRRRLGQHITEALMLPALHFVAAAYLPGNIKRVLKTSDAGRT